MPYIFIFLFFSILWCSSGGIQSITRFCHIWQLVKFEKKNKSLYIFYYPPQTIYRKIWRFLNFFLLILVIFFRNIIEFVTKIINFFSTMPNFAHTKKNTGHFHLCSNFKNIVLFVPSLYLRSSSIQMEILTKFWIVLSVLLFTCGCGLAPLILYPASVLLYHWGAHVCVCKGIVMKVLF
jgi:hypothetical protein